MQRPAKTHHRYLFSPSIIFIRFNTDATGVPSVCFVQLFTQSHQYRCSHLDSFIIIIHVIVLILGLDDRLFFKNLQTPCIPWLPFFLPFSTCVSLPHLHTGFSISYKQGDTLPPSRKSLLICQECRWKWDFQKDWRETRRSREYRH